MVYSVILEFYLITKAMNLFGPKIPLDIFFFYIEIIVIIAPDAELSLIYKRIGSLLC